MGNFVFSLQLKNKFMLTIILIAIILIGLAIGGIAIKMLIQKDGQFSKTCNSVDVRTGEKLDCICGDGDPKRCVNYNKHHQNTED
jgi:hypothetical protein